MSIAAAKPASQGSRVLSYAGALLETMDAALADHAVNAGKIPAAAVKERYQATLKGVDTPMRLVRLVTGTVA